MMPHEAVRAAEMAFSFAPAGQTWQTEGYCVLQNAVQLTDPVDNGHLGLWSGPLRAIWSFRREHTNRD